MIKIEQLLPLLKKGWVAMDEGGEWWWYSEKPVQIGFNRWGDPASGLVGMVRLSSFFDIEPVEDWTKSLMRCGDE